MNKTINKPEVFVVIKGSQREHYIRRFTMDVESGIHHLEKFAEEVKKDPMHAFQWADSSFEAAAKHSVAKQVLYMLTAGDTIENIRDTLMVHVIQGAKYVPSSTSRSSNYIKLCQTAKQADAIHEFRNCKNLDQAV